MKQGKLGILEIEGGNALSGMITPSGNKNAALPMLAASILTDEPVRLTNVPRIGDVLVMLEILRGLGCECSFEGNTVDINPAKINTSSIPQNLCSAIRTSFLFVAPLLHRTEHAEIYPPGGDVIGRRRLDAHFYGLETMGTTIELEGETYIFDLKGGFQGKDLFFDEASVTATEHILTAAVVADGVTIIRNAASEPHVQDLARMLISMGAKIEGLNTNTLTITGVPRLTGTDHRVDADHIEVVSFLALAAASGGSITLEGVRKSPFWMANRVFERLGVQPVYENGNVSITGNDSLIVKKDFGGAIPRIDDGPWPQFPSDMMSSMIVLATQAEGTVLFFEKMFESRLYFVDRLIAMGADCIVCDPHRVVVSGKTNLSGITMSGPDIRAGMALITAGLCAKGTSRVKNMQMIDRGYDDLDNKLLALGAKVRRVES